MSLVHLLLSRSLLIVQDEFQKIVYIGNKIFLLSPIFCMPLPVSQLVICLNFFTPAGIMITLFCSVLLTAVDGLQLGFPLSNK